MTNTHANTKGKDANGPSLSMGAQYIKDLSFENADFLAHMKNPPAKPETHVNFDVSAESIDDTKTEVTLRITAGVKNGEKTIYLLELSYVGLFMLSGLAPEMREDILMTECPRLLFPFVRAIVTNITQDSGFPPLYLAPAVDFGMMWQQKKSQKEGNA